MEGRSSTARLTMRGFAAALSRTQSPLALRVSVRRRSADGSEQGAGRTACEGGPLDPGHRSDGSTDELRDPGRQLRPACNRGRADPPRLLAHRAESAVLRGGLCEWLVEVRDGMSGDQQMRAQGESRQQRRGEAEAPVCCPRSSRPTPHRCRFPGSVTHLTTCDSLLCFEGSSPRARVALRLSRGRLRTREAVFVPSFATSSVGELHRSVHTAAAVPTSPSGSA